MIIDQQYLEDAFPGDSERPIDGGNIGDKLGDE